MTTTSTDIATLTSIPNPADAGKQFMHVPIISVIDQAAIELGDRRR
jgi:hypothetical protein